VPSQTTATLFSDHSNQSFMQTTSPGRYLFVFFLIVITIAVAIILNTQESVTVPPDSTGILAGNVSIGPLCPVEPCTIDPDRLAAAYAARRIIVSMPGGAVIAEAAPDPYYGYSFVLRPGSYVVDIQHQGIDLSPDLPKTVTIRAGDTVRLDISIDTGIR
jgi:hypothetical protein